MMERLSVIPGVKHVLLKTQYRMFEAIAQWPSEFFYDSKLQTDRWLCREHEPPGGFYWPSPKVPMAFVHHEHSQQSAGSSLQNENEAELCEGSSEQNFF